MPIAAHPPATTSDLTFEALVARFVELALQTSVDEGLSNHTQDHVKAASSPPLPLGLKLDFKEPTAVGPCLKMLQASITRAGPSWRHPVWLNADIFSGTCSLAQNQARNAPMEPTTNLCCRAHSFALALICTLTRSWCRSGRRNPQI